MRIGLICSSSPNTSTAVKGTSVDFSVTGAREPPQAVRAAQRNPSPSHRCRDRPRGARHADAAREEQEGAEAEARGSHGSRAGGLKRRPSREQPGVEGGQRGGHPARSRRRGIPREGEREGR
jgi:hypothetical protein